MTFVPLRMPRYKWRRHGTIMATWFPIWALRGELSSKNVLVEFQVSTSSASVKSQSPRIILVFLTVRSNCDYDHVWVCVHVLPCQVCVPREGCHELRVGPLHGSGGSTAAIRPHLVCGQDRPQQLGMRIDLDGRSQGQKKWGQKTDQILPRGRCREVY